MADLMTKGIFIMIAIIVIFSLAPTAISTINATDLTNVSGTDVSFTGVITGILIFVGIALAAYAYVRGKK